MLQRHPGIAVAIPLLLQMLFPQHALAQGAGNLVPSTFEPQGQQSAGTVRVARDPGAVVPAGADRLSVSVGNVRIEGAFPQLAEANAAFEQSLAGKRVQVSEIFLATSQLEAAYSNAGYVLSRVVLPQQEIRDGGTLRIVIVDGFIERIDATGVPDPARARAVQITAPLAQQRQVRLEDIERALLLAGDTYGASLSSTLATGQSAGGTELVIDGDFRKYTGFVGLDNTLSDDLGTLNLSFGAEMNGALKMGETIYLRAGGSPVDYFTDSARYRYLAAGAVFPIGYDGLTFNIEGTSSDSQPDVDLFPNESSFDRLSFRLFYPWIRSRQRNLSTQLIFDRVWDSQDLLLGSTEFPIYEDNFSALRASIDGSWNFENGSFLQASVVLSKGFGADTESSSDDTPLSRQGASKDFTKLVFAAAYDRPLSPNWSLAVNGRIQSSFGEALVTSEQFTIANTSELSTFDAGDVRGDSGWVVRTELGRLQKFDLFGFPLLSNLYTFGAYGAVSLEEPTIFEKDEASAYSYGIGADLMTIEESPYRSGSVRVEYGRGERDDLGSDGNRFTIIASRRF
ncbi:ShlB/FhaC/HecB family hemolysin secretion/activation protein [Tropicimonas sp. TH_r6]|uniref:ShlB/FhaC/HecB family hemolysin secretion/activation protein n=1 Tax=Tropicimonas sp. TH_r6 TaxID=3082085 RepID=UPI0029535119|nr:ShlB/FhaC/HecB family hemolysin secretion/activation protein [Tropicimonas sp. TH_r6]MDV7143997.1 ShlB/FhaC/HecB family hemolysin secretion/activation protein [Tropicimonas sp. TH_r6]